MKNKILKILAKNALRYLFASIIITAGVFISDSFGQKISNPVYRVVSNAPVTGAVSECTVQTGDKIIEFQIIPGVMKDDIKELKLVYLEGGTQRVFSAAEIKNCRSGGGKSTQWMIFPDNVPADIEKDEIVIKAKIQGEKLEPSTVFVAAFKPPVPPGTSTDTLIKRIEAESRDAAELYVSGELIAENGEYPKQSADVKYERVFGPRAQALRIGPYFELKLSNQKDGSDLLKTGVKIVATDLSLGNSTGNGEQTFRWEAVVGLESDHKFRVTNFMTTQKLKWLVFPKIFRDADRAPKGRLIFTPFVGLDFGRNLKTPVARDERLIARPMTGATLSLKIFKPFKNFPQVFKDFGVQSITWENTFERRWYLTKEQAYDADDDGNLVLRDFGKKPRSYFVSSLQFKLNQFFAPALSYEWGEQPPLYKKVDHRVKIGFVYSFGRGFEEE